MRRLFGGFCFLNQFPTIANIGNRQAFWGLHVLENCKNIIIYQ